MTKALGIAWLLVLAGCAGTPRSVASESACSVDQASYACQVERYQNVAVP